MSKKEKIDEQPEEKPVSGLHLKIVVLMCGACLMALEMAGVRILEPQLGTATYVWGSIIGIFLGALSLGYWLGGMLSDKYPSMRFLGGLILASALIIFLIPPFATPIAEALNNVDGLDVKMRALISSFILYAVPSALLGMVSPFAVRLSAKNVNDLGKVAGSLYAISTLGSIIGTFLASFVLVEIIGSKTTVWAVAATLVLVSIICFIQKFDKKSIAACTFALLAAFCGWKGLEYSEQRDIQSTLWYHADMEDMHNYVSNPDVHLESVESAYHKISVVESDWDSVTNAQLPFGKRARYMKFNNQLESGVVVGTGDEKIETACGYVRLLNLGVILTEKAPTDVLMIGCGGGVGPWLFAQDYAGSIKSIDVVDIDQKVFDMARKYFRFPQKDSHPIIRAHVADGRLYTVRAKKKWDYIILDAYTSGGRIPRHLITREFFEIAGKKLQPGGVVVANIISALDGEDSRLFKSVFKTMQSVYGTVYVFPRGRRMDGAQNLILVATPGAERKSVAQIQRKFHELNGKLIKQPGLRKSVKLLRTTESVDDVAVLLEDDFCPVDSMVVN